MAAIDVRELLDMFLRWAPLHAELCRRLQNGNPVGAFGQVLVAKALGGRLLVRPLTCLRNGCQFSCV